MDPPKDLQSIPPLDSGNQFGVIKHIPTRKQVCFWVYIDLQSPESNVRSIRTIYLLYQSQSMYATFHDRIVSEVRKYLTPPIDWDFTIAWYIYENLETTIPIAVLHTFENMASHLLAYYKIGAVLRFNSKRG